MHREQKHTEEIAPWLDRDRSAALIRKYGRRRHVYALSAMTSSREVWVNTKYIEVVRL